MIFSFVKRNPLYSVRNWRRLYKVRKAMKAHKAANPSCEWCDRTKSLETHHIQPVLIHPLLAGDKDNMISLCRKCHLTVAHNGDFGGRYVENIKEVCRVHRVVKIG